MIADHPWFGTGQGTFTYAFPAYRSVNVPVWGVFDMAHSTLLQLAAEMGVPVAAAVVFGWLVVFGVLLLGTLNRRRDRLVPVAALAVAILAVLHSMIDFSLQIPGYSIVALALIGAGLGTASSWKASNSRRPGLHPVSLTPRLRVPAFRTPRDLNIRSSNAAFRIIQAFDEAFDVVEHVSLGLVTRPVRFCGAFARSSARRRSSPSPHCLRRCLSGSSSRPHRDPTSALEPLAGVSAAAIGCAAARWAYLCVRLPSPASVTNWAVISALIDQPNARRENNSMTAAPRASPPLSRHM